MKPLLILALLALTACDPNAGADVLVCHVDGRETYRATSRHWIFTEGSWWNRSDRQQYRPSMSESCHTERAA